MSRSDVSLRLIQKLLDALSHSIRTPLSVIANELHYASVSKEALDGERIQAQCDKVLAVISAARLSPNDRSRISACDISEICKESEIKLSGDSFNISTDEKLLKDAIAHIKRLESWKGSFNSDQRCLELVAQGKAQTSASFSLLTEYFNENLGRDTLDAPLADALLLALGVEVKVDTSLDIICVKLIFPN